MPDIMPNYENILFVSNQPLIRQLEQSLFLNEFREAGFRVDYLCTRELCRVPYHMADELSDRFTDVKDFRTFRRYLKELPPSNTFVFLEVDVISFRSLHAFRMLKDYDLGKIDLYKSVFLDFSSICASGNRLKRLLQALLHPQKLEKILVTHFSQPRYKYCFSPGAVRSGFASDKYLPINYFSVPDPPDLPSLPEHYGVYVDQGFGLHPDWFRGGFGAGDVDAMYRRLNDLFRTLEEQQHCDILIAGHPKTSGQDKFFPGRKIYLNMLEPLIRHADFVIGHDSVGLNYAIMYHKPLLLCRDDALAEIKGLFSHYRTGKLAELLNIPVVRLNVPPSSPVPVIDVEGYDNYLHNYIVGDPKHSSFYIIANALNPEKAAKYAFDPAPGVLE
jgi:hypothetical protein